MWNPGISLCGLSFRWWTRGRRRIRHCEVSGSSIQEPTSTASLCGTSLPLSYEDEDNAEEGQDIPGELTDLHSVGGWMNMFHYNHLFPLFLDNSQNFFYRQFCYQYLMPNKSVLTCYWQETWDQNYFFTAPYQIHHLLSFFPLPIKGCYVCMNGQGGAGWWKFDTVKWSWKIYLN